MKYPIILHIKDENSFEFFSSKKLAEMSMETIDVENGLYDVFDAEGREYNLSIKEQNVENSKWNVFSPRKIISPFIDLSSYKESRKKLKSRLLHYYKEADTSNDFKNMSYEKLIEFGNEHYKGKLDSRS